MRYFLLIVCSIVLFVACTRNNEERVAYELARRILPNKYADIEFRLHESDTNYYSMYSNDGKLCITADCAGSMAKALGDYLRDYCHTNVSWFLEDKITEPVKFPSIDGVISRRALVPNRFFFNYCTYAYTVGYWNWNQWERLIDWMAMNGVTMALAHTGHEAVWQKAYQRFGLSDKEILSYFTGPSTLPFNTMANIEGWHGPLPQKWIDKQIIEREKSLGISPILNSFTGYVLCAFDGLISTYYKTRWMKFPEMIASCESFEEETYRNWHY